MNSRYLFFIMLCLAFSSVSAKGFYVGLNANKGDYSGEFSVIDERLNPSVGITEISSYEPIDESLKGYSLFAGYKLASDIAFEIGVANSDDIVLHSFTGSSVANAGTPDEVVTIVKVENRIESSYMYAAFIGVWPLQHGWALSGRVGISVYDMAFKLENRKETRSVDSTEIEKTVQVYRSDTTAGNFIGLGVSYGLAPNVELKFSIEQHNVDFAFTNLTLDGDLLLGTLGVAYHF